MEVTDGAGFIILNVAFFHPVCPSVFVTRTSHSPGIVDE